MVDANMPRTFVSSWTLSLGRLGYEGRRGNEPIWKTQGSLTFVSYQVVDIYDPCPGRMDRRNRATHGQGHA